MPVVLSMTGKYFSCLGAKNSEAAIECEWKIKMHWWNSYKIILVMILMLLSCHRQRSSVHVSLVESASEIPFAVRLERTQNVWEA